MEITQISSAAIPAEVLKQDTILTSPDSHCEGDMRTSHSNLKVYWSACRLDMFVAS